MSTIYTLSYNRKKHSTTKKESQFGLFMTCFDSKGGIYTAFCFKTKKKIINSITGLDVNDCFWCNVNKKTGLNTESQ